MIIRSFSYDQPSSIFFHGTVIRKSQRDFYSYNIKRVQNERSGWFFRVSGVSKEHISSDNEYLRAWESLCIR